MLQITLPFSRRAAAGAALAVTIIATSAAGAATFHRLAVTSASGSGGATTFVQGTSSGSALQGEVASSANTGIKIPFGVLGEYNPSGTTFGVGVVGLSATGYGVAGETLGNNPAVLALGAGSGPGLAGSTASTSSASAVYGEAQGTGYGGEFYSDQGGTAVYADAAGTSPTAEVYAESGGDGMYATSSSGYGIEVNNGSGDGVHSATSGNNASGVAGINNGSGIGVYGISVSGLGVQGGNVATASPAPSAEPFTYAGTLGYSTNGPGMYGLNIHATGVAVGYATNVPEGDFAGLYGFANDGAGLFAYSNSDFGAIVENGKNLPTLLVNSKSTAAGGLEIAASSGGLSALNFTVDHAGNVTHTGAINAISRNPNTDVATYAAQQTESTVEDMGSAQLINGLANVRIADDFRSTTDGSSRYMVFLTPYGENNGLYIASRGAGGFVVREVHGGRSSLSFDYRVVAHPYGSTRDLRLPHLGRTLLAAGKRNVENSESPASHFDGAPALRKIGGVHARHTRPTRLPASTFRDMTGKISGR